jgi:catechol 2,3-dioxygenase-like lactoylglutathione lyase family enzyme
MGITVTKDSIDLGIVVRDIDAALGFYRDTLGFTAAGDSPMPGGAHMHRLMCGTSTIKLIAIDPVPEARAPTGGIAGATGYRYWTISVGDVTVAEATCRDGGYKVVVSSRELIPGVSICIVEDPDGNLVEFLQTG